MSHIAPANPRQVAYDGTARPQPRFNYRGQAPFRLTIDCHTKRGLVLDGIGQSPTATVSWTTGKHCIKDGSNEHLIMQFLETCEERSATYAEIAAAFPTFTSKGLQGYLRELGKKKIITQSIDI